MGWAAARAVLQEAFGARGWEVVWTTLRAAAVVGKWQPPSPVE